MSEYKICSRCVMDNSDPNISFDENGVCNHCYTWESKAAQYNIPIEQREQKFQLVINQLKENGRGKDYDCVIGLSGGVDSSYVAHLLVKHGVRPLALHLDNGWNSELAVKNIENIVTKLNIDLYTHVLDWEEFKSLQISFLKASTPDSEIPSDHAIMALMFQFAVKHGVKHVVTGVNHQTESHLPRHWSTGHNDWKYIQSVHRTFLNTPLSNYPYFTLPKLAWWLTSGKLKILNILDYVDYDKPAALDILSKELDWKYYGGKHYESIYTRFFQGYILPEKFGFDKRKTHLSSLICSGKITREEALKELEHPTYPLELQREDKEYAAKKLGMSLGEFEEIMSLPPKTYWDYPNNDIQSKPWYQLARKVYHCLR